MTVSQWYLVPDTAKTPQLNMSSSDSTSSSVKSSDKKPRAARNMKQTRSRAVHSMSSSSGSTSFLESSDKKPHANNVRPTGGNQKGNVKRVQSAVDSSSSRSSSTSGLSVDLTLMLPKLKKKNCPHGKKQKAWSLLENWCCNEQKVEAWFKLGRKRQDAKWLEWNKLTRTEKMDYKKKVPGKSKKITKKKKAAVSGRTRSKRDKQQKTAKLPVSMADNSE